MLGSEARGEGLVLCFDLKGWRMEEHVVFGTLTHSLIGTQSLSLSLCLSL